MSTVAPPPPRPRHRSTRVRCGSPPEVKRLGVYTDSADGHREIVSLKGAGDTTLVVDRNSDSLTDARLVAHLAADEPSENAQTVCAVYLGEGQRPRFRPLAPEDYDDDTGEGIASRTDPADDAAAVHENLSSDGVLADRRGTAYRLKPCQGRLSIPELRWCVCSGSRDTGRPVPVSVREVVGALESYEPVRAMTLRALARNTADPGVSVALLGSELERLLASPVVLNRGLREAVAERVGRCQLTCSEIAKRCGRVRRDIHGNVSGETSWLARRTGRLPEPGAAEPTPWIHSNVLALIARQGLAISPRDVEL